MNTPLVEAFINRFFGYGTWEAPVWFVGMEEGGCPTLADLDRRLDAWRARGCMDLEDCPSYHSAIGCAGLFGDRPKLQRTWEKLIRVFLSYEGQPSDTEAVRTFQQQFGSRTCGFASLELFPLPSTDTSSWIYGQIRALPYLINREVYKYYVYPRRAEELRRRIAIHGPKWVVIYGREYRHEWEGIVGQEFGRSEITDAVQTAIGDSRVIVIPHPVSRGHMQTYWSEVGQKMRESNQTLQPTPIPPDEFGKSSST